MKKTLVFLAATMLVSVAWAQANDLAAERARLANQRIDAEARAREEQERQARLAAERERAATVPRQATAPAAVEPRNAGAETPGPAARIAAVDAPSRDAARPPADLDRVLEQIRTLGELRDAGYVTDTEFERIKQRILDGSL